MQVNLRIGICNINRISNPTRGTEVFLHLHHADIVVISETYFIDQIHFHIKQCDIISSTNLDNRAHSKSVVLMEFSLNYL